MAEVTEDALGMTALAEDVVDVFEIFEVTLGKPFLVGDEEVAAGSTKPARENALEENIGIEPGFATEKAPQWRDAAAMAYGDLMSRSAQGLMDEIHVTVQAYTVGACDDVDSSMGGEIHIIS